MQDEPPTVKHERSIHDKSGRQYKVTIEEVGTLWVLKVHDGKILAARSNCSQRGEELLAGDIHVLDAARPPQTRLYRVLKTITGWEPKPRSYRGRGLGTEILKLIIERAAAKGVHEITGNLLAKDLTANPRLPSWYRKFGFDVKMTTPESGTITLRLP